MRSDSTPGRLLDDSVLELRGDGKAGGGLVLAFQSLAALLLPTPGCTCRSGRSSAPRAAAPTSARSCG